MPRRVARTLMSGIFIASGVNALRKPAPLAGAAEAAGLKDAETLVRVHGATNLLGGLALATNRVPRLAALGLAAGLVPTTYVGHPFWSAPPEERAGQQTQFLKNLALIGGLLVTAADTGGRESIPHAVSRVSKRTTKDAARAQDDLSRRARKKAAKAQSQAQKQVGRAQSRAAALVPV